MTRAMPVRAAQTAALALAMMPVAGLAQAPAESALARMAWLAGCWRLDGAEPGSHEQWLAPAGGSMLGVSRTIAGGRTASFEFMQLRIDAQGRLVFVAHPGGRAGTSFMQAEAADGATTIFESARPEFPQRVAYRRLAGERLLAWIEGLKDGRPARIEFAMTRSGCEGATPAGTAPDNAPGPAAKE